jgi:hypothetical protein
MTSGSKCAGCRQSITWSKTRAGKWTPVNSDGTAHWASCQFAAQLRRWNETAVAYEDRWCRHCQRKTMHLMTATSHRRGDALPRRRARCARCRRAQDVAGGLDEGREQAQLL